MPAGMELNDTKMDESLPISEMRKPFRTADEKMVLLKTYFKSRGLIHHHVSSFNYFIDVTIPSIVQANNVITCEEDPKFRFQYIGVRVGECCHTEDMVKTSITPQECRYRDMTYSAPIFIDATYVKAGRMVTKNHIHIGNIPVMLKSKICVLTGKRPAELARMNECPMDPGGYFIIRGQERAILMQENLKMNRIMIGKDKKGNFSTSCASGTYTSYKTRCIVTMKDQRITLKHGSLGDEVPVIVVLKALGVESAQEVVQLVGTESKFSDSLAGSIEQVAELNVHSTLQAKIFLAKKLRGGIGLPKKSRMALTDDFLEQLLLSHIQLQQTNQSPSTQQQQQQQQQQQRQSQISAVGGSRDRGKSPINFKPKIIFLCTMIRRVILASRGELPEDDKDYFGNKKIDMAGDMLALLFEDLFKRFNSAMSRIASQNLSKVQRAASFDIANHIRADIITNGFATAISTGTWNLPRFKMDKVGVTEIVSRLSYIASVGILTRVISSVDKTLKTSGPRSLHGSQFGIICPSDTPEGHSIGLVKNLTLTATITVEENPAPLMKLLLDLGVEDINVCNVYDIYSETSGQSGTREFKMMTPYVVFVNGTILGVTRNREIVTTIRLLRRSGRIHEHISVYVNDAHKCIYVSCDGGRCSRPLIIIDKEGKSKLLSASGDKTYIENMKKGYVSLEDMLQDGVIEFLDVNEQNDALIAFEESDIVPGETTHLEMNTLSFLGICASLIPYPHHNQSPRNTYQCLLCDTPVLVASEGKVGEQVLAEKGIGDLKIGDEVVSIATESSVDGDVEYAGVSWSRHRMGKVTAIKKGIEADRDVVTLVTKTGQKLVATEDHLIFTSDGWKEIGEVRDKDLIAVSPLTFAAKQEKSVSCGNEEVLLNTAFAAHTAFMAGEGGSPMDKKAFCDVAFLYSGMIFVPVHSLSRISPSDFLSSPKPHQTFVDISVGDLEDRSQKDVPPTFVANGVVTHNCAMGKQAMGPQGYMQFKRTDTLLLVQVYNQFALCGGRRVAPGAAPSASIRSRPSFETSPSSSLSPLTPAVPSRFAQGQQQSKDNFLTQGVSNKSPGVVEIILDCDKEGEESMTATSFPPSPLVPDTQKPQVSTQTQRTTQPSHIPQSSLPTVTSPTAPPLPCGFNATVCVCSYSGYDIEDAIVIGAHAAQRGLGAVWAFKRETSIECGAGGFMRVKKEERMGCVGSVGYRQQSVSSSNSPIRAITTMATTFNNPTHASIVNMNGANIFNTTYEGMRTATKASDAAITGVVVHPPTQQKPEPTQPQNESITEEHTACDNGLEFAVAAEIISQHDTEETLEAQKTQENSALTSQTSVQPPATTIIATTTTTTTTTTSPDTAHPPQPSAPAHPQSSLHPLLDSDGLPRIGSAVFDEDPIACKLVAVGNTMGVQTPTTTSAAQNTPAAYRAHPTTYHRQIPASIHSVTLTSSARSPILAKIVTRQWRYPELGDKYSSRHGQKGTVGLVVRDCDFPMTHSGHIPDLIMNPHGFPSRMTVGKMLEMVCGKAGVLNGHYGDGSAFGGDKIDAIGAELVARGFNYGGKEVMYSGITGMPLSVYVFFGPIFYQRLKHMVVDKMHARSNGPKTILTRQPTEGRAKDGGLRLGEMERDCLVSYGAAGLVLERLMTSSDEFLVSVCSACGLICMPHWCQRCRSGASVVRMRIPYACKLMFQELMAMGVVPRVILKEAGAGASR